MVKKMPRLIDAERHGYWCFEEFPDGYYHWECSECKKWFEEDSMSLAEEWKYCPNCGAKMNDIEEEGYKMRLIDAVGLTALIPYEELNAKMVIANAPTVDAVEVVRCKDCIHYWKNKPSDDVPMCLASPKDDAFCSEGERREDEAD